MHTHLWQHPNLPHALLFVGDSEQTLSFAQEFAHGLLCAQLLEGKACLSCPSCLLWAAQNHPDFVVLKGGIDSVRSIMDFCEQTPQCGNKKIIIIPEAQQMHIGANNALLKTLEEPAGNSYFILTSNLPAALPATVRSRCQMIRFPQPLNSVLPSWQAALHDDCSALLAKKMDPLAMAQKWQKEDILILLGQMEIYFAKIKLFTCLDKINAQRKLALQHHSLNPLLQLEALLIDLTGK